MHLMHRCLSNAIENNSDPVPNVYGGNHFGPTFASSIKFHAVRSKLQRSTLESPGQITTMQLAPTNGEGLKLVDPWNTSKVGRSFCPSNHNCRSQRGAGNPPGNVALRLGSAGLNPGWEDLIFGMIYIYIYIQTVIWEFHESWRWLVWVNQCLLKTSHLQNLKLKKWDLSFYNDYTDWSVINRSLQGSSFFFWCNRVLFSTSIITHYKKDGQLSETAGFSRLSVCKWAQLPTCHGKSTFLRVHLCLNRMPGTLACQGCVDAKSLYCRYESHL